MSRDAARMSAHATNCRLVLVRGILSRLPTLTVPGEDHVALGYNEECYRANTGTLVAKSSGWLPAGLIGRRCAATW